LKVIKSGSDPSGRRELCRLSDATSWPDYVKRYLMDTAEGIDAVIVGVRELRRRLGWGAKISETQARQVGERVMAAAGVTTGVGLGATGYVAQREEGRQIADPNSQEARSRTVGISPRTQRKLDRLARERPDLLDAVRSGRLSAHGAAIAAGIVKPSPDAYTTACRAWAKMIPEERDAFEDWIAGHS
jgi:hypothetical protein